ncbi:MAG TPA: tetratricopeptide repeat-containing sensor histidine kinase [Puia sp.]|nr:tetratricopeptide repeat-containing sensor histidine kinase [Puia sp.]
MYPRALVTLSLLCFGPVLFCRAQSSDIGDLFEKVRSAAQDTDKVNLYYAIGRLYWNRNPDSALLMGQKAIDLSQQSKFEKGIALGLQVKGVAYAAKGKYPEALNCQLQALRISERLGLEDLIRGNYNDIGILYTDMRDYAKALDYLEKALETARQHNSRTILGALLTNIGEVYKERNQYDSAIIYNTQSLAIARELHDSLSMAISLLNIGDNYGRKRMPEKALGYLEASLRISEKIRDDEGLAYSNNLIAETYHQSHQYQKSIDYGLVGLSQAKKLGIKDLAKGAYHTLYSDYRDLGDLGKALEARNEEIALNDSLYNLEKEKELKVLQSDYDLERQQHQIDLLNKDKLIQQSEITRGRIIHYLFIGLAFLLGLWAFFLVRSNLQKQQLNKLLKAQNEEIVMQNQQLADINTIKNKLLSIIGHDLRSPVSSLKGFVDLLRSSTLTEEQIRHFSNLMSNSLVSTSHLLDNLLFWAKSQMEGMRVSAGSFDLQEVIRQNKNLVQSRATEKEVLLVTDEKGGPVMVYADEIMVDMVIRNLVENAIKFSRAGDMVTISARKNTDLVTITVQDTGTGIHPDDHPKIFNRSVSYTTSGTSREKGSGLGLSLCKELVEKNGGKIWFESEPEKGTSFTFTLPAPVLHTTS